MLRNEDAFRQGHWFSYVFLVDQFDETKKQMSWTVGGFQGGEVCAAGNAFVLEPFARSKRSFLPRQARDRHRESTQKEIRFPQGANGAAEWNVENVKEELDAPNEWFYDDEAGELFWCES
eukprot:COSAG06_NODE_4478_length_4214_cov_3.940948_4_plen_120_part_00